MKKSLKELVNAIKEPYELLKKTIAEIIPVVKKAANKVKDTVMSLQKNLSNVGK